MSELPVVVIGAVLLAVIPVLFFHGEWQDWLYRALSFLVISCPCALVISIPLGYFGGIGAAGKRGILIKGSMYIDALAATDEIVFDKTGTLTAGSFAVQSVVPAETGKETELLRKAAGAEFYSDHPIAVSVLSAAKERGVEPMVYPPHAYREIPGRGVAVETESARLLLGNRSLMIDERIAGVPEPEEAGTILFAAENGVFIGYLAIADRIKDDAVSAIGELRRLGIKKISILTGDRRKSADATASQLRVDGVYSDLLPKDKLDIMDTILYKVNRNFLMQMLVTSCKKMQVYHVDDSQNWDIILNDFAEKLSTNSEFNFILSITFNSLYSALLDQMVGGKFKTY